jgi:hypothetical protein
MVRTRRPTARSISKQLGAAAGPDAALRWGTTGALELSRKQWRAQRGRVDDGEWVGQWTMCIEATAPPPPPSPPRVPSPPRPPPSYPVALFGGMLQGETGPNPLPCVLNHPCCKRPPLRRTGGGERQPNSPSPD